MKVKSCILAAVIMCSCGKKAAEKRTSHIDPAVTALPDSTYVSVNKVFLDKFSVKKDSVFWFLPTPLDRNPARGVQISAEETGLFPLGFPTGNPRKPYVYALFSFAVDKGRTALVTRNPGSNFSNSLQLSLYDHRAEGVVSTIEVAAERHDRGYFSRKETVIYNAEGKLRGIGHLTAEVGPKDENDPTHPVKLEKYYRITVGPAGIDTAAASQAETEKFSSLLANFKMKK